MNSNRSTYQRSVVNLEGIVLFCTLLLFYSDVLSGLLRYVWHSVGLEFMMYIPMLCVVAVTFIYLLNSGTRSKFDLRITGMICFIVLFGLVGLAVGRSPAGVLFAFYSWVPFFLGMMIIRFNILPNLLKHVPALLLISLIGVFISAYTTVPWLSAEGYQIGGTEVEVAHNWDAFGVSRLPGFSRASYVAANDITMFFLWWLCTPRSLVSKLFIWLASIYAVILTTSKTPMMVVAIAPLLLLVHHWLSNGGKRKLVLLSAYSYSALVAFLTVVIGLPLIGQFSSGTGGRVHLPYDDVLPFLRIESFTERVQNMWPNAFKLLEMDGGLSWLIGRGLAGIGVGQKFTELDVINSGDNLHVFLYVTFGLFACLFYAILVLGHKKSLSLDKTPAVFYFSTLVGVMGLGTLTCIVEGIVPLSAFGMLIAICLAPRFKRRQQAIHFTHQVAPFHEPEPIAA